MHFLARLRRFIRIHNLIPDRARVVVGVSGGPDSLALLHALHRLAPQRGWQIHAAYLNHGLRPEAEAEAHFVAELAAAWGLGCTIERADVMAIARQPGVSLEEAARQARYAFLARTAHRLDAPVVAVGHHADDQVETILMHLLRGSGLAGLRGMPPAVDLGALRLTAMNASETGDRAGIALIRPLLPFSREAILAYCREQGLEPRWDLSNLDRTFFRNRLRHDIIPRLKEINPNLTVTLTRTAFALQGDYETLEAHRRALWDELAQWEPGRVRLELAPFRALLRGDQRALLRRAIAALRPEHRNIRWEHTERVLDVLAEHPTRASGGPYTLTAGLIAYLSYDWLDIQETDFIPADAPQILHPQRLPLPGQTPLGPNWRLRASETAWEPGEAPWKKAYSPNVIWLPIDIPRPLMVRPRRIGDNMRPLGLPADKPIKDLMNERKIPRAERDRWPLLVDSEDRILWLVGHRASELTRIPPDANRAWEIELRSK
ncbi:MAG TPA: tRNA lysidine(34) synthetase TilS [Caldilineae bacterium]|nr:tRNA lysidine(34) synthetase TilS [Caldilineae bacterium]